MRYIFFILIFSLSGFVANSQDFEYLKDHPGQLHSKLSPRIADAINYKYTKAEEQQVLSKLEAIVNYIKTQDGFKDIKGIEVYVDSKLADKSPLLPWLNIYASNIYVDFHPWFKSGGKVYNRCNECSKYFNIHINKPEYLFNGQSIPTGGDLFDTDGALINLEPKKIVEQDGAILYTNGTIVISKPGIPVWLPLTVRQYDNLLFDRLNKLMKEKPEDNMTNQFFYDKLKEEMSQFSEEDLDKPAWLYAFGASPEPMGDQARPLVKLNKAYFDQSKPKTDIQLMIIEFGGLQDIPENPYYTDEYSTFQQLKLAEAMKTFKYSGLIKLLE
jgi:hypothetical protein